MISLMKKLFPINRSLTGKGTLTTLKIIQQILPNLKIKSIKSRQKVFDWTVPDEWNVNEAYVKYKNKKIIDFKKNNLHLVGYSIPVHKKLSFKDFQKKIYFLKKQPEAIPYVTSYYKKDWGFCLSFNDFSKLDKKGEYEILIDSQLKKGKLNYGEILIKGESDREIFLNTYICHPSMANNELSGPCVLTYLVKWIEKRKNKYSYRITYAPETIGAIINIKKNRKRLKKIIAAFNFNCLGGPDIFSILNSRNGNTYSDNLIKNVLIKNKIKFKTYNWLERGSDERQYCWPGVDLPMVSLMKSKYHDYPEYHTSKDNLKFVKKENLNKSLNVYKKIILQIEKDIFPISTTVGEPNLGKRGLYKTLAIKNKKLKFSKVLLNILSQSDGKKSIFQLSNDLNLDQKMIIKICYHLRNKKILKISEFIDS